MSVLPYGGVYPFHSSPHQPYPTPKTMTQGNSNLVQTTQNLAEKRNGENLRYRLGNKIISEPNVNKKMHNNKSLISNNSNGGLPTMEDIKNHCIKERQKVTGHSEKKKKSSPIYQVAVDRNGYLVNSNEWIPKFEDIKKSYRFEDIKKSYRVDDVTKNYIPNVEHKIPNERSITKSMFEKSTGIMNISRKRKRNEQVTPPYIEPMSQQKPQNIETTCNHCHTLLSCPSDTVHIQCPKCMKNMNPHAPQTTYIHCPGCQELLSHPAKSMIIQCPSCYMILEKQGKKRKKQFLPKHQILPKRAMNAYMCFCKKTRAKLRQQNPNLEFGKIGSRLGEIWRSMTAKEKKPYQELAYVDTRRYKKELIAYEARSMNSGKNGVAIDKKHLSNEKVPPNPNLFIDK